VPAVSLTSLIAALLLFASRDIPRPEFHRHELARRVLLRAMRVGL
jgi:hypothetical protein